MKLIITLLIAALLTSCAPATPGEYTVTEIPAAATAEAQRIIPPSATPATPATPTTTTVTPTPPTAEPTPTPVSLGAFTITVYSPYCDGGKWGYQTATGVTSEHLATCAVDPSVIPLGSVIEVGGLTLRAVDTGSAVKGNMVDIFFDGEIQDAAAWVAAFGTENEVWVYED